MDIIIKEAEVKDAQKIIEYFDLVGKESDNLTYGKEGAGLTLEHEEKVINAYLGNPKNVFYVAWFKSEIIGDVYLTSYTMRMQHRANLGIIIRKDYWHKGVGSKLMEKAIEYAKSNGIELIDLEVRVDNIHAIELYKKYGFIRIGTSPAYLKIDNEYFDCDLMVLDLRNKMSK